MALEIQVLVCDRHNIFGEVRPVNGIPTLFVLIIRSPTTIQTKTNNKKRAQIDYHSKRPQKHGHYNRNMDITIETWTLPQKHGHYNRKMDITIEKWTLQQKDGHYHRNMDITIEVPVNAYCKLMLLFSDQEF